MFHRNIRGIQKKGRLEEGERWILMSQKNILLKKPSRELN